MTDSPGPSFSHSLLSDIAKQCTEDSHTWFARTYHPDDWDPVDDEIDHHLKALAGEVGELLNKWKKYERGSYSRAQMMEMLPDEWADIFTYLMNIPVLVGFDPGEQYNAKREYNQRRFGQANT